MAFRKPAALIAASLITVGTAASAQSAQSLSLASSPAVRASASTDEGSDLRGMGYGAYLIGAIALGLIVWGIIEITDDDNPTSP